MGWDEGFYWWQTLERDAEGTAGMEDRRNDGRGDTMSSERWPWMANSEDGAAAQRPAEACQRRARRASGEAPKKAAKRKKLESGIDVPIVKVSERLPVA